MTVATPELDKRRAVAFEPREPAQVLTEFYDWLQAEGIVLARWGEPYDVQEACPTCHEKARGIDPTKLRRRHKDVLGIGKSRSQRSGEAYIGITVGEMRDYLARLREELPACPDCDVETPGFRYVVRVNTEKLAPHHEAPERLFARFFGIDLAKIDAEQRAILEALRAA